MECPNFEPMKINIREISAILLFGSALISVNAQAQSLRDLMKGKGKSDTAKSNNSGDLLSKINKAIGSGNNLSTSEVVEGLKAALDQGVTKGVQQLSAVDGYLGNAAVKILMPPEAKKVESTLRGIGLGKQVDQAITSMNRAAEDAAKSAAPIFITAIKNMTITDAVGLLSGNEDAITQYLKAQTSEALTKAFKPIIDTSLGKTDATKYWNTVFTNYNRIATEKINPDLTSYVTEKALSGLFGQIALEEANIRKNPAARGSEILKKVFAN